MSMPTQPTSTRRWSVVVPVKDTLQGKSRLARAAGPHRSELSRAIADDTLSAVVDAVGADHVVLVTSDRALAAHWRGRGCTTTPDPGAGLNAAVAAGLALVPVGTRAAALLGDVPTLTPADLLAALRFAAAHDQSFVPDGAGTGTVLRCGTTAVPAFVPRFGPASAAAHTADGARRLELALPRLRTDVDDAASLADAGRLGLGPATRAVLRARGSGWMSTMQASVHRFDPDSRSGSVLLDDGLEIGFDHEPFDASGLRLLRSGQRVTIEVDDHRVVALHIVGIGPGQPIR